ncbi:MAG: DUF4363 family protein [Clostridia bacterium]|nr:DUF4363 family protein [Clostridia bacterium]
MKEKILSVAILIAVLAFTTVNTIVLNNQIKDITDTIVSLSVEDDDAEKYAKAVYDEFKEKVKYISLTVSHDDIRDIEDCFVEMIGYLSVGDDNSAEVTKDRLTRSLEHLRRLSGFNIDAII